MTATQTETGITDLDAFGAAVIGLADCLDAVNTITGDPAIFAILNSSRAHLAVLSHLATYALDREIAEKDELIRTSDNPEMSEHRSSMHRGGFDRQQLRSPR